MSGDDCFNSNTRLGCRTLPNYSNTPGNNKNTAIGFQCLSSLGTDANDYTAYSNNSAFGYNSLQYLAKGSGNLGVGMQTLQNAINVKDLCAVGNGSLRYVKNGTQLTACGRLSGNLLTNGSNTTMLVYQALGSVTNGTNCIAIGANSLLNASQLPLLILLVSALIH